MPKISASFKQQRPSSALNRHKSYPDPIAKPTRRSSNRVPLTPRTNTLHRRSGTIGTEQQHRSIQHRSIEQKSAVVSRRKSRHQGQPQIPPEILHHIARQLIAFSDTKSFSLLDSFSRASSAFRAIALYTFFANLHIDTLVQWNGIRRLLGLHKAFGIVRSLSIPSHILGNTLGSLVHLESLTIDCKKEGLASQHNRFKRLLASVLPAPLPPSSALHPQVPALLADSNLPLRTLASLTISDLPRMDAPLLQLLARAFPNLVNLRLSSTERLDTSCCWTCFEESTSCVVHSPGQEYAIAWAEALRPLTSLAHIHFGILLSDEDVLLSHFGHSESYTERVSATDTQEMQMHTTADGIAHFTISGADPGDPIEDGCEEHEYGMLAPYGPASCKVCRSEHGAAVRTAELRTSVRIAQRLESVQSIGWSSFFSGAQGAGAGIGGETRIWVLRRPGTIRVRRTPW